MLNMIKFIQVESSPIRNHTMKSETLFTINIKIMNLMQNISYDNSPHIVIQFDILLPNLL